MVDLLTKLLTTDLSKRFGNLKAGPLGKRFLCLDIKNHKWFADIDFELLAQLKISPPYVPPVKGDGDTSNFDEYSEDFEPYGVVASDPYREKFKDF